MCVSGSSKNIFPDRSRVSIYEGRKERSKIGLVSAISFFILRRDENIWSQKNYSYFEVNLALSYNAVHNGFCGYCFLPPIFDLGKTVFFVSQALLCLWERNDWEKTKLWPVAKTIQFCFTFSRSRI